jgi:hypothetical protein
MFGLCLLMRPVAAAAFFSLVSPACGQIVGHTSTGATQSITLTGTATGLTIPSGTVFVVVCVETAAARFRDDGSAPSASTGIPLAVGTCATLSASLNQLQFIAQSGSPLLTASYYR